MSKLLFFWQRLVQIFLLMFARPNLPDGERNRTATVLSDFFGIGVLYNGIYYLSDFGSWTWVGSVNYCLYIVSLIVARHLAVKGSVRAAAVVYVVAVISLYLEMTYLNEYFEHLQATNMLLALAAITIALGPVEGGITLLVMLGIFYGLLLLSTSGVLTPLSTWMPDKALPVKSEWYQINENLVELYLFCWLVRTHIYGKLKELVVKEQMIASVAESALSAAQKADLEKSRFLASASHDLRQPITSLGLNFELHCEAHPELQMDPVVTDMRTCIGSLNKMLDSILTVSKLDAKALVPQLSDTSLNDLILRCIAANSAAAKSKGIQLRFRPTNLHCKTDLELLFRSLNNLVDNAVKYTQSGGVLVGVRRRFGGHALYVIDSGTGIPNESINSIFDEFVMLEDSSRKSGSGLGLAVVRKTLDLLGMPIHTHSVLGKGSTFYIELPETHSIALEDSTASMDDVQPVDTSPIRPSLPVSSDEKVVLVVEDVPLVRATLVRFITRLGMTPLEATNIEELKSVTAARAPDLLISDYKLENGLTGYDVIREARKLISPSLPAFILTGDTSPDIVSSMSTRGIDVYYKPISRRDLGLAIDNLLATPSKAMGFDG